MAKTAADYPITFRYGAIGGIYTPSHPHRGDDRACPTGTPIVIGNTTIGLTGNTGLTTGAHLHIQEWFGVNTNVRKPQNSFQPGTVIGVGVHKEFGNYINIRCADGWVDTYAHLSKINVQSGQVIQGGAMADIIESMLPLDEGVVVLEAILPTVNVWDLRTAPNFQSRFTYKKGQRFEVVSYIDANGTRYYVSNPDALRGRAYGVNRNDIKIIRSYKPVDPATVNPGFTPYSGKQLYTKN